MLHPGVLYAIAETIDLSPASLEEEPFATQLTRTIGSLNGEFTNRATERGIDNERAADWMATTQGLVDRSRGLSIDDAADLAVRLYALSFLLSDQPSDAASEELLATATPPR